MEQTIELLSILLSERTTAAEQVEDDDYKRDNKQDVDETSCEMKAEAE
jgi:hypothetical protein